MNLIQLFDVSLRLRAAQPALEWQGEIHTFGDIDTRSNRLAQALAARGVRQGDRIAVYLANRIEFIDLFLATLKLGAIFVAVNILYRERELGHILSDSEPKALIAAGAVPAAFPTWQIDELTAEAAALPADRPVVTIDGDDAASLIYTSGTTGVSKGAILTHNNFAANTANILTAWQITAADRLLLALPLFHVHGLGNGIHAWLASGLKLRLLERFESGKIGAELLDFKPTLFFGVPTMYVRLMELGPEIAREIGQAARMFVCGSAPLPAQLMQEFEERFGSTILERYGMTETLMNISNPYAGERRPGSVGLPLPGVSVKILSGEGLPAAPGETGELYVKGPNVCAGYWRREEASAAAFTDGWFRTGDLGMREADGYYTLQGRRSDLIISGGFNIYPREIEEFLLEQPEVAEAAVVGMPDRARGELPFAYLVAQPGATIDPAVMEARCRAALASFKLPRGFLQVPALPRNALGKVQKHLLPR